MEKGIVLYSAEDLANDLSDYEYLYYGSEFCIRKLLRQDDWEAIVSYCLKYYKTLCLMTSYIPQKYMDQTKELIKRLAHSDAIIEISVNDYGLLDYIAAEYDTRFVLTYGRLLNRIKKAPSMFNFYKKLTKDSQEAFQINACNNKYIYEVLREFHIRNIQYDNVMQSLKIEPDNTFQKHLMYPLVQISTARRCLGSCLGSDAYYTDNLCDKGCDDKYYMMYNNIIKRKMILYGNTIFYENETLPANINEFSRLVFNRPQRFKS